MSSALASRFLTSGDQGSLPNWTSTSKIWAWYHRKGHRSFHALSLTCNSWVRSTVLFEPRTLLWSCPGEMGKHSQCPPIQGRMLCYVLWPSTPFLTPDVWASLAKVPWDLQSIWDSGNDLGSVSLLDAKYVSKSTLVSSQNLKMNFPYHRIRKIRFLF